MGQYHTIYNKTKKEYYSFGGAKLWEKASSSVGMMGLLVLMSNSNGRGGGDLNNPIYKDDSEFKGKKHVKRKRPIYTKMNTQEVVKEADYFATQAALDQVSGRWAGDEIVIQGDYAEKTDPAFISEKQLEYYTDITGLVVRAIEATVGDDEEVRETIQTERKFARGRF